MIRDLRPLLGQVDPTAQQLVPLLDFIGLYKPELTGFFANVAGATQARSQATGVHYLRTTNPFNPENLAVYPRRIGSNRPNAYMKPRGFDNLRSGVEVYEDRHCNRAVPGIGNQPLPIPELPAVPAAPALPVPVPVPTVVPTVVPTPPTAEQLQALIPGELLDRINKFAFSNAPAGSVPAPPCKKQAPYTYGGETTQYPHVKAGTGR